jgi:hypothetical protein
MKLSASKATRRKGFAPVVANRMRVDHSVDFGQPKKGPRHQPKRKEKRK